MLTYDCWLYILEFLGLEELYNVILTNRENERIVVDYIKRNRVIDCKGRNDFFLCLLDKGYRVILGKIPWEDDVCALGSVHTLTLISCRAITGVSRSKADTSVQRTCGRRQRRNPAFRYRGSRRTDGSHSKGNPPSRYRGRPRKPNRHRQRIFQLHQPGRG